MLPDNTALFPGAAARAAVEAELTTLLQSARQRVAQGAATPTQAPAALAAELAAFTFETPTPLPELLPWVTARLETGLVQLTHPRYLGLFNPAPSFPAECADRIAAAFNPQLASATTSPAAVAMEAHVIRAVAARAGLPAGAGGHFTSGGSEANATALILALTAANPAFAHLGARAYSGQPVFYISADSHLAWIKIAHQTGLGREAARLIPTDDTGRLHLAALEATIAADRATGAIPVMLVATAGTTNAGMVDPLTPCAAIAWQESLWFHVDAAWGGGVLASPRHRHRLAGIEAADSITIDAHKWFAATMGCGMFLTPHTERLAETFAVTTSFMPSFTPSADPYVNSLQWSRRFLGLRLFLSLAAAGWSGHAAHVERSFALTNQLATALTERGWRRANGPDALAVACLTPPPASRPVPAIAAAVQASGQAWLSAAHFAGADVIRACVTHGETTETDIEITVKALEHARQS